MPTAPFRLPIPPRLLITVPTYRMLYGRRMRTMTYTESRARYAETLDAVIESREPIVITRANREPVVMLSLAEYESIQETAYLMASPVNASRLLQAADELLAGKGVERRLIT